RSYHRLSNERDQAHPRRLPVLRLQPILAAVYQQDTITADPVACQSGQPLLHGFWKIRRRDVEAKLDGGRDLVDVLASGSRGPDKAFVDLTLVERQRIGDPDHRPI